MIKAIYQKEILYPEILWERPVHYYKSKAGRVLIIAGSSSNRAPALLTSDAVFKSGTGILTLAFPEGLKDTYAHILPDAMTLALPQTHPGSIARKAKNQLLEQSKSSDMTIIGPGLSTNTETVQLVWELLQNLKGSVVMSEDGVMALAYGIDAIRSKEGDTGPSKYFKKLNCKLIIILSAGEAGKILSALNIDNKKCKANYIEGHKNESAEKIYSHLGGIIVIKGKDTAALNGKEVIIDKWSQETNEDILAGVIGSFVAQNPTKIFKATATAIYLHSLATKMAAEDLGQRQVTANAILKHLPKAIKVCENK